MSKAKPNWPEARQHFIDWWNREGLVLGSWVGTPACQQRALPPAPPEAANRQALYQQPQLRANHLHYEML